MEAEHDRQYPIDRSGIRRTHVKEIDGGIVQCTIECCTGRKKEFLGNLKKERYRPKETVANI